ncbi:DUF7537 family lipoprotein [Halorussus marinus]|uniref:DUF7537 family lipoprotein n=1 Tax=Halorussus marinus TaxID=2505976 RepID=UPI001091E174|nr:hypothetical protein [Halorussus marinus]
MRASTAALVLAAATLLAGCSGGTVAPTATETTTDAPPVTDEGANATFAPGLNESGVADAAALVAAHRAALNETGFAFAFRANVTVGPASQRTVQRGRVETGLAPLVVNSTSERDLGDETTAVATDIWANHTASVVRYDREDWTRVRAYNRSGEGIGVPDESWAHLPRADLDSQVTNAWLVELALAAGDYDIDRIEERDGREVAVLRATEPAGAANVTDLDATAVVDREGRVHELSLTAGYEGEEPTTRVHYEFELADLDERSVERPKWVAPALRSTNATAETPTTAPGSD